MSTDIANLLKRGWELIDLMVGRIRESSSSADIWGARGRVDWPPMSRIETSSKRTFSIVDWREEE